MKFFNLLFVLFLTSLISIKAQTLDTPESVVFDSQTNQYFITNTVSGQILKLNQNNQYSLLAEGFTYPRGMVLIGDVLYFTAEQALVGINKSTGTTVLELDLQTSAYMLNDICYDGTENLYMTDMAGGTVVKYSLNTKKSTVLNLNSSLNFPNGIIYDNGNLICVSFGEEGTVYSINIDDLTVTTIANTNHAYLDGIAKDNNNNYLISSWGSSNLLRFSNDFSGTPELIKGNLNGPADFLYRSDIKTVIVPLFNDNALDFIQLSVPVEVELSSPANLSVLDDYTTKFEWQEVEGAEKYKFELSTSDEFASLTESNEFTNNYTGNLVLDPETKYYWRVAAYTSGNWSNYSDVWSFTTGSIKYEAPALLSPANNADDIIANPVLIWSKSKAGTYEVALSDKEDFSDLTFSVKDINDTSVTVTTELLANTTYYWKVKTYSGANESQWSEVFTFTTLESTTNSINEITSFFTVGPNPTSEYLNISSSFELNSINLEIIDGNGSIVKSIELSSNSSRIDIKELNSGAYLLNVINCGKSLGAIKFIKM